jgi:diacylglycerol kinase (ATP)
MVVAKIKILVVYNPQSGRRRKKEVWYLLHQHLAPAHYQLDRLDLTKEKLADKLVMNDFSLIIVIGGDGTLSSVIDYLQRHNLKIPIALMPYGSANLIATSLNLPRRLSNIATAIKERKIIAIDIARLKNGQYYVGAFAMGYLSDRIVKTDQKLKRRLGFLGYIITFIKQTKLPLHTFDIVVDGRRYRETGHSLFIVNTVDVFGFPGRRRISYQDSLFELVVTTNKSFFSLVGLIYDFYFRRKKPRHFFLTRGKTFSVYTADKVTSQADGEILADKHQADIQVLPKRQEFIIP